MFVHSHRKLCKIGTIFWWMNECDKVFVIKMVICMVLWYDDQHRFPFNHDKCEKTYWIQPEDSLSFVEQFLVSSFFSVAFYMWQLSRKLVHFGIFHASIIPMFNKYTHFVRANVKITDTWIEMSHTYETDECFGLKQRGNY